MKIAAIIIGVIVMLAGLGCTAGGGALAILAGPDNWIDSGDHRFDTPTYALVSDVAEITSEDLDVGEALDRFGDFRVRIEAEPRSSGDDVFIGVGRAADVDRYLSGVSRDVVNGIDYGGDFHLEKDAVSGDRAPGEPAEEDFWVSTATGTGRQTLDWKIQSGSYRFVMMNADATQGVDADAALGVHIPHAFWLGIGILIAGLVFAAMGVVIIVLGARAAGRAMPPATAPPPAAPPPDQPATT